MALVLTNRQNAFVLERAKGLGVPCVWFAKSDWESGELVLSTLREHDIDLWYWQDSWHVCRTIFCMLIPINDKYTSFVAAQVRWKGNVRRPCARGSDCFRRKESGITIHYTNEHYDEGGIICQQKCPVLPGDTPEELAQRIHRLEYEYYPKVIEELVEGLSPSYL